MIRRSCLALVWTLAAAVVLVAAAFGLAQTGAGKRLIAEQLGQILSGDGTTVRLEGLNGLIPFDLRLDRLQVADGVGVWLELDDLVVASSPAALLGGRLDVAMLDARRVALHRLPVAEETETEPFQLPRSVPPVVVRAVGIERLELDEAVLGEGAVFTLSGDLATRDGGRAAELVVDLRRIDEDTANAVIEARLDLDPLGLALDAVAEETGGLLAAVTGRPDAGNFTLELRGEGPLDDWRGKLRVAGERVARAEATIDLAIGEQPRLRLDGTFEPAPGLLPAETAPLLGDRLELGVTAVRTGPEQVTIEDLELGAALGRLTAEGKVDLGSEQVAAQARLEVADLAPLGALATMPLTGSIDLTVEVHGPLDQPEGRLTLGASGIAAGEIGAQDIETTLDVAVLAPLGGAGVMARVSGGGRARGVTLPSDVPLPPQEVDWQIELAAPVGGEGPINLGRLAVSADHVALTATGTVRAPALDGEAQITLTVDDLGPLTEPFGQPLDGAAELRAKVALGAGARSIDLDLSAKLRELAGLPPGAAELLGPAPTLTATAVVRPDERIEIQQLAVEGANASLAGRAGLTLAEQAVDGALTLDLPRLAVLAPVLGVEVDGPLQLSAELGGTIDAPSVRLAGQSDGLLVAGEHLHALAFTGRAAGTAEALDGEIRFGVTAAEVKAELASAIELKGQTLTLTGLSLTAPRTKVEGGLTVDLERQLLDGDLKGRVDELSALRGLLPVALRGQLELQASATSEGGAQTVAVAAEGRGLRSELGRLQRFRLQGTLTDALAAPRLDAGLTFGDFRQEGLELTRGEVDATGSLDDLTLAVSLAGDVPTKFVLDAQARLGLGEEIRLRVEQLTGQLADQPIALAGPATVTVAGESMRLESLDLSWAEARLAGDFSLAPGEVAANASLDGLTLASLGQFGAPALTGEVSAEVTLRGQPANPSGTIELAVADLANPSLMFADLPPGQLALTGALEARRLRLDLLGEGVTEKPLRLRAELPLVVDLDAGTFDLPTDGALTGSLDAEVQLARLADIVGLDDQRLEGPLVADLTVGGTLAAPTVDGTIGLDGGLYENGATGTVLRDLALRVRASDQTLTIEQLSASDGGQGRLEASGTVDLDLDADRALDVRLTLRGAQLIARDDVVATMSGDLTASGSIAAPKLAGEVTVDRADISIPERLGPDVASLDVQWTGDDGAARSAPSGPAVDLGLDLIVNVPGRVFVRGRGLESEWQGRLEVQGSAAQPKLTGLLKVKRGDIELLGKRFDLREGEIRFSGVTPPNPTLNLEAVTQAEDITAVVRLQGDATKPKLELDSEPSLPEDEILSRLLFGREPGALGATDALKLAAAVNTLRGGTDLLGQTRAALGLDTIGVSGGETAQDSRVRAGKYLNDRVYIEAGKGVADDSEDVRVEVEILPNLSFDADTDAQGNSGVGLKWRFEY